MADRRLYIPPADGMDASAVATLQGRGLPEHVLTIFRAVDQLRGPSTADLDYDVDGWVIGYSREDDELCLDRASHRVLLLATWRPDAAIAVNDSLTSFVDCLDAVLGMAPFYPQGVDMRVSIDVARSVRDVIDGIDRVATLDPDGFWGAFLDDLANGDYPG
ncbi:SUKH-4 family immunity protein [Catenulispora rubra]|uniref:SUKH-4 family immunity protein n=1 Tax=Catenulispora rubra TaxID=280293 RepID=UPI0018926124|nr:SUKH-4 family immunity protein [Catenulispora rubra]